jgi:hypothetical protein
MGNYVPSNQNLLVFKNVVLSLFVTPSALQIFECVSQMAAQSNELRLRCDCSVSLMSSVCAQSVDIKGTVALEYLTLYKFSNFPVPCA